MNKLLVLGVLLCAVFSANGVILENLCRSALWTYKDVKVNSVHRVKLGLRMVSVGWYAIDEFENFGFFPNATLKDAMVKIKKEYNSKIMKLYSERFLNNAKSSAEIYAEDAGIIALYNRAHGLWLETRDQPLVENKIKATYTRMLRGRQLIDYVAPLYNDQFPQTDYKIDGQQTKVELRERLRSIITGINFNQTETFALSNDLITDIYELQIITKPKFVFHRHSKTIYDFRSTGEFNFDLMLPVHNQATDNKHFDYGCLYTQDLPMFYKKKPNE